MSEWTREYTEFRKEIKLLDEAGLARLEVDLRDRKDKYSHRKYLMANHERVTRFPGKALRELFEEWDREAAAEAFMECNNG